VEPLQTLTFTIDQVPPHIIGLHSPDPNANNWNNSAVTIMFQCSDALSGLDAGSPPAPTLVSSEGARQSVTRICTDVAGNAASLTVADINLDLTPPLLTSPADQTVTQTEAGGAIVNYPVPMITETGSGLASSSCSPTSGSMFPVGATIVTCTATDVAGNVGTSTFVVTVNAAPPSTALDGRIYGAGHLTTAGKHHHFVFRAGQINGRDRGDLEYWASDAREEQGGHDWDHDRDFHGDHDHNYRRERRGRLNRFDATSIAEVALSDDAAFKPGRPRQQPAVDSVRFTGTGRWNGRPGYTFDVTATDRGEPGRGRDTFSLMIKNSAGNVVASVSGTLDGGNIQSTRLIKKRHD
jgi:hypothetical protein